MEDKNIVPVTDKEHQDVKYVRELNEYWNAYMWSVINEIYVGTGIALGLSESQAYEAAKNKSALQKARFFKSILDKFKSIFGYKVPKFRPKKGQFGTGKPLTQDQWDQFNRGIDKYWQDAANKITNEMAVKSFLLGRNTSQFREKKKPYKNKSLYQVVQDQYNGRMPDNIAEAYKRYDFKKSEKNALNKAFNNMAMYVTQSNNEIKEAIRQVVNEGLETGKTSTEIASDLYWNVQNDENLTNKYTAETLRKNWNRIASTEMQSVYEAGILAPHESDAMESLKDPSKAKYFVRIGGTCEFCRPLQGTVVRLIPAEIVEDKKEESLKAMGINDPNTDIAIWPGKNNVGLKRKDFLVCCPAHPWNTATFAPIDLKTEFYNPKTGDVEKRQEKQKYIPQLKQTERPKDYNLPKKIGGGLVQVGANVYEAVPKEDTDRKLEEWRKDTSKPIPVPVGSPQYRRIFEAAE